MPAITQLAVYEEFLKFRETVLDHGKIYRIRRDICEDIFQDSIIVVLEKYKPERGSFKNFMITVFTNNLKDHLSRDKFSRLFTVLQSDIDENDIPESETVEIEIPEGFLSVEHFVNTLRNNLTEEEKGFLNQLQESIAETDSHGLIAEVSRQLGISNDQGWNIWRRIRRKATEIADERSDQMILEPRVSYINAESAFNALSSKTPRLLRSSSPRSRVQEPSYPLLSFLSAAKIEKLVYLFSKEI
jgi:DNA-directed RNA polymerase specialized sigma24 family protein